MKLYRTKSEIVVPVGTLFASDGITDDEHWVMGLMELSKDSFGILQFMIGDSKNGIDKEALEIFEFLSESKEAVDDNGSLSRSAN